MVWCIASGSVCSALISHLLSRFWCLKVKLIRFELPEGLFQQTLKKNTILPILYKFFKQPSVNSRDCEHDLTIFAV